MRVVPVQLQLNCFIADHAEEARKKRGYFL
jgi:hypothetical protein